MTETTKDGAVHVQRDLIFDLGMHEGQDTGFYLKKGFRVVAVDANAQLCEQASMRFKDSIANRALTIVNCAVARQPGEVTFYDNDNTHWGTIDPLWAARNLRFGASSRTQKARATTLGSILGQYGVPYFMKIDIEGMDIIALEGLRDVADRPHYVSIESDKVSFVQLRHEFEVLVELGYDLFKLVSQGSVPKQRLPNPPREGMYVEHLFVEGSSGAFGEEAPGEWISAEQAIEKYRRVFLQYALTGDDPYIRSKAARLALRALGFRPDWFDTHAKHSDAT